MKLYGLKNCDTCRKAMKQLDAAGVNYDFLDVRDDGVSKRQVMD
ncbi:MAG: arsenate reductase, partial [Marinicaulis sp.]|nr:arsenate reductase [Marinicaulis sp.]